MHALHTILGFETSSMMFSDFHEPLVWVAGTNVAGCYKSYQWVDSICWSYGRRSGLEQATGLWGDDTTCNTQCPGEIFMNHDRHLYFRRELVWSTRWQRTKPLHCSLMGACTQVGGSAFSCTSRDCKEERSGAGAVAKLWSGSDTVKQVFCWHSVPSEHERRMSLSCIETTI